MLHLKTINKFKVIVLAACTLFSVSLFAQSEKTNEESIIVMTKEELSSFLSTIAELRRSQLKERQNKSVKQDLAELRLKYYEQSEIWPQYDNISNQQIIRELRYLNQRIDNLSYNTNGLPSIGRDNSTIIMPSNSNPNPVYPRNDRNYATTLIPSINKKINKLQAEIDSLKHVEANKKFTKEKAFSDSLGNMQVNLKNIRQQMDSLESKMMKTAKTKAPAERTSYFKQQVYFDNNSTILNATYFSHIQDLIQILVKYPEAKVMLEGWASPLGNTNYNKQLSMQRAETVEQAFINNGVDPARIIAAFKGEDNSSSDGHARRVEMSIIVK